MLRNFIRRPVAWQPDLRYEGKAESKIYSIAKEFLNKKEGVMELNVLKRNARILKDICEQIKKLENRDILTCEEAVKIGGPLSIMLADFNKRIKTKDRNERDQT